MVVLALWYTLRMEGDRWWVGTLLLMSPRWPFAAPLILLWPWALLRRRWLSIAATAGATFIMLAPVMGFRAAFPGSGSERGEMRVLSCNVHRTQLDVGGLSRFIAEVSPDVVALQDWSTKNDELMLFPGEGWHIKKEGELLVASRFPIGKVTALQLPLEADVPDGERGAAAWFELETPRGTLNVINVHLASPHVGLLTVTTDRGAKLAENSQRRWRESELLRVMTDSVVGPLVLAGDFNTPDDSPIYREHWGEFADAFDERGAGFGFTYLIGHTQLRIDHILADQSWQFVRCSIGPQVGSPHRPLVADLNSR